MDRIPIGIGIHLPQKYLFVASMDANNKNNFFSNVGDNNFLKPFHTL